MIWVTWPLDLPRKVGESSERGEREAEPNERIASGTLVNHLYFDGAISPDLEVQVRIAPGLRIEVALVECDRGEILGEWSHRPEPLDPGPHPERGLDQVAEELEAWLASVAISVDILEKEHRGSLRGIH